MALVDVLETLGSGGHFLYGWVWENGTTYRSKVLTRSEWKTVRRACQCTVPRECFANCQRTVLDPLFLSLFDIADSGARAFTPFKYVEGYVAPERVPIPILHAWLTLHGKVIDPTLVCTPEFRRKTLPTYAMGRFPKAREYYGVEIPWDKVAARIVRTKEWGTVLDDWKGNWPLIQNTPKPCLQM